MNDEQLRTLTRSDQLADRARALLGRIRHGELSYERIEWAARLGHEDALAVVGELKRPPIHWASWFDRFYAVRGVSEAVGGLDFRRVLVAFGSDCAERVLPIFESRVPGEDRPRKAIEAARAWVRSPTAETLRAALGAAAEVEAVEAARRRIRVREAIPVNNGDAWATTAAQREEELRREPEAVAADAVACVASDLDSEDEAASGATSAADKADRATSAPGVPHVEGAEFEWQRRRLAEYALGEVGL